MKRWSYKIYETLMKNNVTKIEIAKKKPIKSENLPWLIVTFGISTYQNVYIAETHNLWKIDENIKLHTLMIFNNVWKYLINAIKSRSIP